LAARSLRSLAQGKLKAEPPAEILRVAEGRHTSAQASRRTSDGDQECRTAGELPWAAPWW